jgi:hypothetical protein
MGALEAPSDESATFACSPIGCAWAQGVIRLGWGGPEPAPKPELALTAAAAPRVRTGEPPAIDCRMDGAATSTGAPTPAAPVPKPPPPPLPASPRGRGEGRPSAGAPSLAKRDKKLPGDTGRPPSKPPRPGRPAPAPVNAAGGPIALRLPLTAVGTLHEHAWTGDVLPPFQPGAALRHLSASDPTLHGNGGSVVPLLGAGARAPIDLLLLLDKHLLRAGAASFAPFDVSGRFTVAADLGGGALAILDADRASLWLSRSDAAASALHLVRVPDVGHVRLTLARRLAGGGLALAAYSTTTNELVVGDLDLGRAAVGALAPLGSLATLGEPSATCPGATHRLLVELPVRLRITRAGAVFDEPTTVSAVVDAGPDRVCLVAIEGVLSSAAATAALPGASPVVLRATLGAGAGASLWSPQGTARAVCSIGKR